MAALRQENAQLLAGTLFVPVERWGWQYVDPGAARESPDLRMEPQWSNPAPPDLRGMHAHQAAMRGKLIPRGIVVGVLLLLGLSLGTNGIIFILLAMVLGVAFFGPWIMGQQNMNNVRSKYERHRQEEWNRFNRAKEDWAARVAHWDTAERSRRDGADLWFPLELRSSAQRVDVFGGTPDGWSALLCTVGATIMESGTPIFVIDFTEEDVTGPLCAVAEQRGFPARRHNVPANLEAARLLDGLNAEAVAELIAESVDTLRRGGADVELRMLDVGLIQAVVTRLDEPVTFRRIAAGLLALQQGYDPDRDERLSLREFQRISDVVDTVVSTERTQNELLFLRGVLDMLPAPGEEAPQEAMPAGMWPESGVCVLRTEDDNRRRRDFVDRLMAQVLLQNLRRHRNQDAGFVLALAGADHLGQDTLELLAKRCRQAGIRLLLMLEHLRGDLQHLLGGSDSVTFLMRLGNAQEAAAAAEYIGRGHRFLLTQLTRQSGTTDTTGTSHATGISSSYTTGTSRTRGRSSSGWFDPPTYSRQVSTNDSRTTSDSETFTTSDSQAVSTTDGETVSRVYEFTVEPTTIQSLDATSFVFVESADNQRRVVAGTCDPYVALMPRVSNAVSGLRTSSSQAVEREPDVVLDADRAAGRQQALGAAQQPNPYGQQPAWQPQQQPWQQQPPR